ncbi:YciI family protein [Algoriphagus sp. D3-2-R+10]|uniref:YciI family protein n=1 Tax=Algoriphagus aurantiacus TaxID=3103948 RepID=UPI002B36FE35|nr:YciI family protein [Algoriphagus sp. D3-2-R+10]MEB2774343.1 YciI family protein [Algoriphagus sp. D3-2-R+10]
MENLKDFMLLFRMQPFNHKLAAEQPNSMQQQWSIFNGGIAAQAKLVSTNRLGYEGNLINKGMNVSTAVSISGHETISGYMVVKATTLKEATEIAKGCPVLAIEGSVEVRNIIPFES